jgi:hypothetical protein
MREYRGLKVATFFFARLILQIFACPIAHLLCSYLIIINILVV